MAVNSFCYDTSNEKEPSDTWAFVENNRRYAKTDSDYLCPVDVAEKDRMDIFHEVFNKIRQDHLHSVPISHPSRPIEVQEGQLPVSETQRKPIQCTRGPNILDIGTGTGIWAIMMARQYPEGIVLGLDRFWYLQPQVIMPNSHFWPMDVERDSWDSIEYNWDMAHARMLMGNIYNWDQLYSKIFKHLRPGTGYFEQVDFDFTFRSEDNSITPSTVFHVWNTKYKDAMNKLGCSVDIDGLAVQRKLRNAGFVDVTMEIKQVPVNPWQRGSEDIGRFMNLAFTHSLQGMLLRPLTRAGGMTPNQVNELVQQLGTEMCYMHWKPYVNLYIWTARRPDMPRV